MIVRRADTDAFDGTGLSFLVLFSALFLLGAVFGVYSAASVSVVDPDVLPFRVLCAGSGSFFGAYFASAKYIAAVFLLASSLLGVFLIPAVLAVRGFLLAFAVSVAARSVGEAFPAAIVVSFLPSALVSMPCLFIAARRGFTAARSLVSAASGVRARYPGPVSGDYFRTFLIVLLLMLPVSLYDCYCVPRLLELLFPALL